MSDVPDSGRAGPAGEHLREIPRVRQDDPGLCRRWFASTGVDLFVWQDTDGGIRAFELCYGKPREERSLRWTAGEGWQHARIDDGEATPTRNRTPIAIREDAVDAERVALEFERVAACVEPRVYRFVLGALLGYSP